MKPPPQTWYWPWENHSELRRALDLRAFAEAGADAVVMTDCILGEMLGSLAAAARWRALLADAGLRFRDAHSTYIGGLDDPECADPALWRPMIDRYRAQLDLCAAFGVETLTVHPGVPRAEEPGRDGVASATARLLRALDAILPAAEEANVVICLENIFFPTCTVAVLLEAVRRFPSPWLGLCWDSGHDNLVRSGAPDSEEQTACREAAKVGLDRERNDRVLEGMLPHVATCHVHSNDGQRDRHWLPDDPRGTVDWTRLVPLLLSAPRLRQIQCEAVPKLANPFSPAQSVAALRNVFACWRQGGCAERIEPAGS